MMNFQWDQQKEHTGKGTILQIPQTRDEDRVNMNLSSVNILTPEKPKTTKIHPQRNTLQT